MAQREDGIDARISLSFAGVRQSFSTRNVHRDLPDGGRSIELQLVDGPFSVLQGWWRFTTVAPVERACKVQLNLSYDFSSRALASVVGPVFDSVAASLVDAFVQRAESLYDGPLA